LPENRETPSGGIKASWLEQRLEERQPLEEPERAAHELRAWRLYAEQVRSSLGYLEFGDPAEYVARKAPMRLGASPLVDVWVMPSVHQVALGQLPAGVHQGLSSVELPLDRVLYEIHEPIQVLLGGPGSGKSTVCRYLACDLVKHYELTAEQRPLIPVVVPVRRLEFDVRKDIGAIFIDAALDNLSFVSTLAKDECREWLLSQLNNIWLVVDGYDEAPATNRYPPIGDLELDRMRLLQFIEEFRLRYPDARILITSREVDYTAVPESVFQSAFHYSVGRFSPAQVQLCIRKWHAAALTLAASVNVRLEGWEDRRATLSRFVSADADVGGLAEVPLLLNMMQVVFEPANEFPRTISHLADKAVRFLLLENPVRKRASAAEGMPVLDDVAETLIMQAMRLLAFQVTERVLQGGASSFTPGEIYDSLDQAIAEIYATRRVTGLDSRIADLLSHIQRGHGVIIEAMPRTLEFSHNIFREVLTGQALDQRSPEDLRSRAQDEGWLLPLRYWAGWKAGQRGSESEACTLAQELLQFALSLQAPTKYVALLAVGEIVTELTRPGSALRDWYAVQSLRRQVTEALIAALPSRDLHIRLRIRIGDIVGSLGDTRVELTDAASSVTLIAENSVKLPTADVTFGRLLPHAVLRPKYLDVPVTPRVSGTVSAFAIAKYPVTNSQYAEFLAGGYLDESLWVADEARKWAFKDSAFIAMLRETVQAGAELHYQTEILAGRITRQDLEEIVSQLIDRREPLYWSDLRFNRKNQPVVGVNFWEACAFCEWLQRRLRDRYGENGIEVFIPSEFEWEYAARRGSAEPYPWGTLLDLAIPDAHVRDVDVARVGRGCAVGSFPWASWPNGPLDIVGNVWEWTSSQPRVYEPGCVEQPITLAGLADRVVRGCSWLSAEPEAAEVTFRSFDPPFNAYEDLGLRVAIRGR
jgi:formylglycine-generating enzyme required for sulfatase activity